MKKFPKPARASGEAVSDLDELERLAGRLRDRGFPKLAPIVRSDLVLRSADAIDALVARVREAEAERDEGWRVAAEQTRLERARAERAEAVIAETLALHPNTDEWWEHGIPVFDEFDRSSALRRGCQRCGYYSERATGKKCAEYEILSRHESGGTDE